jgi:hypothetical protein
MGLVTGFVVGGLGLTVSGNQGLAGSIVSIRVEVFGVKLRQGFGPESMSSVIWTWGVGVLATFAVLGAMLFMGVRSTFSWAASYLQRDQSAEPKVAPDGAGGRGS